MENRKAFNFYRSYFEVVKQLNDEDKLSFLMALLKKQFENIEPELNGQAKFAYVSQKHNIDSQVEGYLAQVNKTKKKQGPSYPPSIPPTQGPSQPPSVQEKEKEKEKEQVKEKVKEKVKEQVKAKVEVEDIFDFDMFHPDAQKLAEDFLKEKFNI